MNNQQRADKIIEKYNMPRLINHDNAAGKTFKEVHHLGERSYIVFTDNTCICIGAEQWWDDTPQTQLIDVTQLDLTDYFADFSGLYNEAWLEWTNK